MILSVKDLNERERETLAALSAPVFEKGSGWRPGILAHLRKLPGVAETIDWAQALASLHANHLDEDLVLETLGCVLKDADDIKRFKRELTSSGLKRFVAAEG